jgi:hypothetical protein
VVGVPVPVVPVAGVLVPVVVVLPVSVPPVPSAALASCTVTVAQVSPVEGVPAVPPVEGVPAVPSVAGVPVSSPVEGMPAVPVPSGEAASMGASVAGGRVSIGAVVGVAVVEQAERTTASINRTPKIFGYFINSLLFNI